MPKSGIYYRKVDIINKLFLQLFSIKSGLISKKFDYTQITQFVCLIKSRHFHEAFQCFLNKTNFPKTETKIYNAKLPRTINASKRVIQLFIANFEIFALIHKVMCKAYSRGSALFDAMKFDLSILNNFNYFYQDI